MPGGAPGASGNLLADGDAGAGYCTHDWNAASTIPGWTVTAGQPQRHVLPSAPVPHPAGAAGRGFFSGGPYGDSAMTQTASLRAAARRIGTGTVRFRLSGWLGGWRTEPGYVRVTLAFRGRSGRQLGGLVTAAHGDRGRAGPPDPLARPVGDRDGARRDPVRPGHGGLPGQLDTARR